MKFGANKQSFPCRTRKFLHVKWSKTFFFNYTKYFFFTKLSETLCFEGLFHRKIFFRHKNRLFFALKWTTFQIFGVIGGNTWVLYRFWSPPFGCSIPQIDPWYVLIKIAWQEGHLEIFFQYQKRSLEQNFHRQFFAIFLT